MLTGESVPVSKTPLPHFDNTLPWKVCGMGDYRRHVLFCGTEVIQTRRAGPGPVRAVVLQTGFNTAKGDLVRSILYPKPLNFQLYQQAFKFIVGLAVIGILGMIYAICVYVIQKVGPRNTVAMALLLLTIPVPPVIPAALTTSIIYAQRRLTRKKIFCISPQRINICGQINLVCFDKTGTLTEDGLDLWGALPCQGQSFQSVHSFSGAPLPWGPLCRAMATCHSLLLLDGRLQGDPLDLKMFEGTNWEMEEHRPAEGTASLPESCLLVKPGPAASPAPVEGILILHQFPFSSSLLRMSVITQECGKSGFELSMKGAPETVASFCEERTVPAVFQAELKHFTAQGYRVIGLAHKKMELPQGVVFSDLEREELESGLTFLGLLVMENRLKSETRPVLQELSQARIRSVMGSEEGGSGGSRDDNGGSLLAAPTLVGRPSGAIHSPALENSSGGGGPASGVSGASGPGVASSDRLAIEQEQLREAQYSESVIRTVEASRRQSTTRIYNASWVAFADWCRAKGLCPAAASAPQVLDFLQEGHEKGLATSTLRRQVSSLSTVLGMCVNAPPLSQHPVLKQFLKGATNLKPSVVHRFPTWDLPTVLQALTEAPFEPLREVSLQLLTFKVIFLVAITSARRVLEINALSSRADLCTFLDNRVILRLDPSFMPKVNSPFHRALEIILLDFCPHPSGEREKWWHKLDVRRALHIYLKRTASFRRSEALFVSIDRPPGEPRSPRPP
ncbi:PREDICTED: probable cation-transporting ATPase 13A5 [Thamnophis sirtalis]|uniref:Probable cation-transporting ATPase 13A5 n=1 Tax=Thamnophis sirtalis TaxID=35019 RepID=A0A6I9YHT4_9SAUR|nr:PREDICTED: probable cation-transporting ATPase 13A5 [Thamnophis sirtalis]